MDNLSAIVDQIAQTVAASTPSTTVAPSAGPELKGPGRAEFEQQQAGGAELGIGEILAAAPGALANVANLLGLNQPEGRDIGAPIPAGTRAGLIPGLSLPQTPAIGQLLAAIPRLR